MDEGGSKTDPSLPPGYVSLEMLRQRWLQMQEEKNLKGEKEEEKRGAPSYKGHRGERVLKNEGDRRRGGGLVRDSLRGRVEDSEGLIEVKEKGKEVVFDSGDVLKQKKKNPRNRKKSESKDRESGNGYKIEDVEIVGDKLKGVQGTEIVSTFGVGEQTRHPKRGGFRRNRGDRGFMRNGGDKLGHRGGKGYSFKPDDGMKEGGVNLDLGKNQREGGRIITKRDGDGVGAFEKDISEVTNGIRDLNNGFRGEKRNDRGKVQEDRIEKEYLMNDSVTMEKMGQDEHVAKERDERGENWGSRRRFRRHGRRNRRGSFGRGFQGSTFGDWEAGNARSRMEWNAGYGRGYGNRQNMHKVWVKKRETPGDAAAKMPLFESE